MKLAWFTPFMRQSAIARYSKVVVEGLAERIDVTLMLPEGTPGEMLETTAATILYGPDELPELLDGFDASVFNMGDSPNHFGVWVAMQCAYARLVPTVAVMHDAFYLHLLHDFACVTGRSDWFRSQASLRYGAAAGGRLAESLESGAALDVLEAHPMSEPIVESADAFIVHSRYCRRKLGLEHDADVVELFIPSEYASRVASACADDAPNDFDDRIVVLTLGVGNPNKCLDLVLMALAEDRTLAERLSYVVVGAIDADYRAKLEDIVSRHALADVHFLGYASDGMLAALIRRADICVNLRKPCLEGGSASLVEMMAAGKATIVFDDGVYAEVPDRCVRKIPRNGGSRALGMALRELVGDPRARAAIGAAARAFALNDWSLDRYLDTLVVFLDRRREAWALRGAVRAASVAAAARASLVGLDREPRSMRQLTDALAAWTP